jgi:hypothetical protein
MRPLFNIDRPKNIQNTGCSKSPCRCLGGHIYEVHWGVEISLVPLLLPYDAVDIAGLFFQVEEL